MCKLAEEVDTLKSISEEEFKQYCNKDLTDSNIEEEANKYFDWSN